MTSWLIGDGGLQALARENEPVAAKFFNAPTSFVLGSPPAGWATVPVKNYASFAVYQADTVQRPWVLYDPESWTLTPHAEQLDPAAYLSQFAALAHSRGAKVIATPARDLTAVTGSKAARQAGETTDAAYLRTLPSACYRCDVLECQAQADQHNVTAYRALVAGAKAEIPPCQPLWAGLTTLRKGNTPAQLHACYEAVAPIVDGFWLNTDGPTAGIAAQFLAGI